VCFSKIKETPEIDLIIIRFVFINFYVLYLVLVKLVV
jgi:hypothetical protein